MLVASKVPDETKPLGAEDQAGPLDCSTGYPLSHKTRRGCTVEHNPGGIRLAAVFNGAQVSFENSTVC